MARYIRPKTSPRIIVSHERHSLLFKEAEERKMDIQDVAEEKFALAESKK